jgi:tetratricopeptide (TPR) repeat protein
VSRSRWFAAGADGPGRVCVARGSSRGFLRSREAGTRGPILWSADRPAPWLPALALALVLAVLVSTGCAKKSAAPAAGASPPPAVSSGRERSQAFITAGNDAYRAGDFELALKRYAAAAVADPRDPAAYFGMGMTFTRLKREDEARAAYARAQQLAREEEAATSTNSR